MKKAYRKYDGFRFISWTREDTDQPYEWLYSFHNDYSD